MASNGRAKSGLNLVAVLLITRSRPGPKLLFHFPAQPDEKLLDGASRDVSPDSDIDSENEDDVTSNSAQSKVRTPPRAPASSSKANENSEPPMERFFGHSVDALEKLLSPGRWCDRNKFEVCLNGFTFVGHPIYSLEDGNWSDKAVPKKNSHLMSEEDDDEDAGDVTVTSLEPLEKLAVHDFTHVPESLDSQTGLAFGSSTDSTSTTSGAMADQMAMFHVVFVLRATDREDHFRDVALLYRDIAKKLSKALHYCQKQSNYVAIESQKLLSVMTKAKQNKKSTSLLLDEMTETSELAWALKELYLRISQGELATVRLSGMEISLHVDPDASVKHKISPLSALLLLESKDSLLRSLSQQDASLLAHFIREHTPTKNLYKHSTNLSMPLPDILYLAHHLLRWRKAREIPPLHQRNTYVVNPSLAVDQLAAQHADAYSRAFPSLPALPHMLKALSGKPVKYGLLIPSRDHRAPYMDILAFLVRHALVVQLKIYAWLRVPSSLSKLLEPPGRPEHQEQQSATISVQPPPPPSGASPNLLSPHLRPSSVSQLRDDDSVSVASDRTAIAAASVAGAARVRKRLSTGTQISIGGVEMRGPGRGVGEENHEEDGEDENAKAGQRGAEESEQMEREEETMLVLQQPARAAGEEARRIEGLRAALEDAELRENFDAMLPFFDGRHALEEIAARLQVKRAKVEEWLAELDRRGWLLIMRHL